MWGWLIKQSLTYIKYVFCCINALTCSLYFSCLLYCVSVSNSCLCDFFNVLSNHLTLSCFSTYKTLHPFHLSLDLQSLNKSHFCISELLCEYINTSTFWLVHSLTISQHMSFLHFWTTVWIFQQKHIFTH